MNTKPFTLTILLITLIACASPSFAEENKGGTPGESSSQKGASVTPAPSSTPTPASLSSKEASPTKPKAAQANATGGNPKEEIAIQDLTMDDDGGVEEITDSGEVVAEDGSKGGSVPIKDFYISTKLINPARLARTGGAATRFNEKEIQKYEYDDPTAIMQKAPGVRARTEDGFGLRPNIGIRGVDPDRSKKLTLMVDHILFGPAPYAAPAAYYFPIMSRMVGIEIFKGPAAILYGPNTIGGSINWVSREIPHGLQGGFDINYGSYNTGKAHGWIGASNDHMGFVAEAVGWRSNGFKSLPDKGFTGFNKIDTMVKGRINTDPDNPNVYHSLELKLGFAAENSHETYLGLLAPDFYQKPFGQGTPWPSIYERYAPSEKDDMRWWHTEVELTHHMELGENITLTTQIYRHDFSRRWNKFNNFVGFDKSTGEWKPVDFFPEVNRYYRDNPDATDYFSPFSKYKPYIDVLHNIPDPTNTVGIEHGRNLRDYYSQGIQSNLEWRYKNNLFSNRLTLGFRLHMDQIRRHHKRNIWTLTQNGLQPIRGYTDGGSNDWETKTADDDKDFYLTKNNRDHSTALAAYVQDQFDWKQLTITPGLRIEHINDLEEVFGEGPYTKPSSKGYTKTENSYTVVLPGIGLYYEFAKPFGMLAGVHRGFSPMGPGASEGGAASKVPETAWNYEAGFRYFDDKTFGTAEVVGFLSDYSNYGFTCSFSDNCGTDKLDTHNNLGRILIYGVEAGFNLQFNLPYQLTMPVSGSYTFIQTRVFNSFTLPYHGEKISARRGFSLFYVPEHTASATIGLQHDWGSVNLTGTFVGPQLDSPGCFRESQHANCAATDLDPNQNPLKTDPYVVFDAVLAGKVWGPIQAYAKFNNILNQKPAVSYRPNGLRTIAPFMFAFGLRGEFSKD